MSIEKLIEKALNEADDKHIVVQQHEVAEIIKHVYTGLPAHFKTFVEFKKAGDGGWAIATKGDKLRNAPVIFSFGEPQYDENFLEITFSHMILDRNTLEFADRAEAEKYIKSKLAAALKIILDQSASKNDIMSLRK